MSIYSDIADSLAQRGATGSIRDGLSKAAGGLSSKMASALGGGKLAQAAATIGAGMATNAAGRLIDGVIPTGQRHAINTGAGMVGDAMRGDWQGAGLRLLDSGLLSSLFPGMDGVVSQARYWGTPTPLFGGLSPTEAQAIYEESRAESMVRKNLWLIEVSSDLAGDATKRFNLFATEVEYAPCTITGDKQLIGGVFSDRVKSSESVELRLTTFDDTAGTIKRWFEMHTAATISNDGTVGVPKSYAIRIAVVHGFIKNVGSGYKAMGIFRAANMELSLSRSEDGLEAINMTFSQLDPFMD